MKKSLCRIFIFTSQIKILCFRKLVAIEPVSLVLSAEKALYSFADEVVMYSDIPAGDNEIIARIADADAVLLSYTSQIAGIF